jgi:hypothetical protein
MIFINYIQTKYIEKIDQLHLQLAAGPNLVSYLIHNIYN